MTLRKNMNIEQHPFIKIFLVVIAISSAVFAAIQYIQVTPLLMENNKLKEQLKTSNNNIKSTDKYQELERKYFESNALNKIQEQTIFELKSEVKILKNDLVTLKPELLNVRQNLKKCIVDVEEKNNNIASLSNEASFNHLLVGMQNEQKSLDKELKRLLTWQGENSNEVKRIRAQILRLQEQINRLISSKK